MEDFMKMFCILILIGGVMSFLLNKKQILNTLLSLELISLSLYFLLSISLIYLGMELFYILYFLVMAVCEAVLGLALLVMISFIYSTNHTSQITSLVC